MLILVLGGLWSSLGLVGGAAWGWCEDTGTQALPGAAMESTSSCQHSGAQCLKEPFPSC